MGDCKKDIINKIVFLIDYPFSRRDYNRFGMEILQKNGFEVEVWDCTPFLNPLYNRDVAVPDPITWNKYHIFPSWDKSRTSILELKSNCFIVCMIAYRYESFIIYRALSKSKPPYCVFMANALPPIKNETSILMPIKKLKHFKLSKIINVLFSCIPSQFMGISPATIILAGGSKSTTYKYPINKKTEILWLHTLDYDIYLEEHCNPTKNDANVCVFLDEYFPFHPDNMYKGSSAHINPTNYYSGICKFFDLIERELGVCVVIAAHPRSNYKTDTDYFNGRKIINGKTVELVKKSRFVICHLSTSINFAVMFNKPAIFITSDEIKESYWGRYIESMATNLGKDAINIDDIEVINWKKEISIDENAYKEYRDFYIKKLDSEDLPFWQIFANHMKNL